MSEQHTAPGEYTVDPVYGELDKQTIEASQRERQAVGEALSRLDEIRPYYYAGGSIPVAEKERYLKEIDASLPELEGLERTALDVLAVPEIGGEINTEKTAAFRKEGHMEVPESRFVIVRDKEGVDWLLKRFEPLSHMRWAKEHILFRLRDHQNEVFASRIGEKIGYPVPETKMVRYNDHARVAYRYMDGVEEAYMPWSPDTPEVEASNQADVRLRPIFNALLDAGGDSGTQGIIDPADRRYYAQDTNCNFKPEESLKLMADLMDEIRHNFEVDGRYGPHKGATHQELADFMQRINNLSLDDAREVFRDRIGSESAREQAANALLNRRDAIVELWRNYYFSSED